MPDTPTTQPQTAPPRRTPTLLSAWLRDLVIALSLLAFIIVFLYTPVKVEGTSMMPSLADQEHIFINKFIYRIDPFTAATSSSSAIPSTPRRASSSASSALPATTSASTTAASISTNKLVAEDYVPKAYEDDRSYPEVVVPPDSYFVLGDHRSLSNDSRDFGPVQSSFIFGKAVFGYWPMQKVGLLQ